MTDLNTHIEALTKQIAEAEGTLAFQQRKRASALADRQLAKPGSGEAALAQRNVGEADTVIRGVTDDLESKRATLEVLRQRKARMDDPAFEAEVGKAVSDALALRTDLDGQCDVVGKKVEVLAKELAKLGEMQNALLELDHEFDRGGFGKASVITWIDDKLGFYTGRPTYVFATHRPARPGTVFAAPSQIEASIRQRMEAKAAAQVRRMIEAGDDGR